MKRILAHATARVVMLIVCLTLGMLGTLGSLALALLSWTTEAATWLLTGAGFFYGADRLHAGIEREDGE